MTGAFKERRKHPRVDAAFDLRLHVELGADGSTPASGTTINVSRGGVLAAVDRRLSLQSHCLIQFQGATGRIKPTECRGVVLRVTPRGDDFLVAIMFDAPLEELDVVRTLWAKKRLPHRGPRGA